MLRTTSPIRPCAVSRNDAKLLELWPHEHNDLCEVCSVGGDILCCDFCNVVYHLGCLDMDTSSVPRGCWACPACITQLGEVKSKRQRLA